MTIAATIVVGPFETQNGVTNGFVDSIRSTGSTSGRPIVCVELLGHSVLQCIVEELRRTGISSITIVIPSQFAHLVANTAIKGAVLEKFPDPADPWASAEC